MTISSERRKFVVNFRPVSAAKTAPTARSISSIVKPNRWSCSRKALNGWSWGRTAGADTADEAARALAAFFACCLLAQHVRGGTDQEIMGITSGRTIQHHCTYNLDALREGLVGGRNEPRRLENADVAVWFRV